MGGETKTESESSKSCAEAREHELLRLNRALATLTRATEALMRSSDEQQLLNDICRIAVETGGYRFAWVGYLQHDEERSVWPVAHFGHHDGSSINISWNENSEFGQGPSGQAIRSGTLQIAHTETSTEFRPWLEMARASGFRSILSPCPSLSKIA